MNLLAIGDLHLGHAVNRQALAAMEDHGDDWLLLAGDVGETDEQYRFAFDTLAPRFGTIVWVPGNHDLWTLDPGQPRGEALYRHRVGLCRDYGVLTPEDAYPKWPAAAPRFTVVPMFLLYDYSFCPREVGPARAVEWAAEAGILAVDEQMLHPDPFPSRAAWCRARIALTLERLQALPAGERLILLNHYPLRYDHVDIPLVPRYSPWCGTRLTSDWHRRFNVAHVVYGHLHRRGSHERDRVRFDEVSLGNPRQWKQGRPIRHYLRQIAST